MLTVAFRHPDPVEARLILDAILMAYQVFLTNQFQDVNKQAADLIENVTTVSKKELETALDNYQKFREQSPILFSSTDGSTATASNIYKTRSESAEAELTTIQIALTEARARLGVTSVQIVELSKPGVSQIEKFAIIDEKNIPRIAAIVQAGASQAQLSGALLTYEMQKLLPTLSNVTTLEIPELTRLELALAGNVKRMVRITKKYDKQRLCWKISKNLSISGSKKSRRVKSTSQSSINF